MKFILLTCIAVSIFLASHTAWRNKRQREGTTGYLPRIPIGIPANSLSMCL